MVSGSCGSWSPIIVPSTSSISKWMYFLDVLQMCPGEIIEVAEDKEASLKRDIKKLENKNAWAIECSSHFTVFHRTWHFTASLGYPRSFA